MKAQPCYCGSTQARWYAAGWRCASHTPARLAGLPEPDSARYCAPNRCHCGRCPSWVPYAQTPAAPTVVDRRALLSSTGRRASLAEYRAAEADAAAGKQRPA